MLICNVVAARSDLTRIAPIVHELQRLDLQQILVYAALRDEGVQTSFEELDLSQPNALLEVEPGTHARQTASLMTAFEEVCRRYQPDLVVVTGDTNAALAVTLVAAKLHSPIARIEAGLRSFDRAMPGEINRVLADRLADLLFTSEPAGGENLCKEGISPDKIYFVGSSLVDTLLVNLDAAVERAPWRDFNLPPSGYAILTLQHPSNVESRETLAELLATLGSVSRLLPVIFPVHPPIRSRINEWDINLPPSLRLVEPLPYRSFLGLVARAKCVLTDSGAVQQETAVLDIPCLTLRDSTEVPVTVTSGTNRLVGADPHKIEESIQMIVNGSWKVADRPPLWDGLASTRIANVIADWAAARR